MAETNGIKIPAWGIGALLMAFTSIVSVAISWGAMNTKVNTSNESDKAQWLKINETASIAQESRIILPRLEKRMDTMDEKLEKIYQAVK